MHRPLTLTLSFTLSAALLGCGSGAVSITEARGLAARQVRRESGEVRVQDLIGPDMARDARHRRARFQKGLGDGRAQSACRARDQCDLAVE